MYVASGPAEPGDTGDGGGDGVGVGVGVGAGEWAGAGGPQAPLENALSRARQVAASTTWPAGSRCDVRNADTAAAVRAPKLPSAPTRSALCRPVTSGPAEPGPR